MAYIGKEPANVGQRSSENISTVTTAGQTVFTLSENVDYESDIIVTINGVTQSNAAFSLGGIGNRTLTFTSGMVVGDEIRIAHHGYKPMTVTVNDGIVTTQKLADNAVTEPKIANLNVTTGKLADNAITEPKIADNAITEPKIAANAVTQAKIHSSVVLGGPSIGTIPNMIRTNAKTITSVITFAGTENGITAGPVTFSGAGAVVVTTGSTWHLLV
jgi:hypothetical protein